MASTTSMSFSVMSKSARDSTMALRGPAARVKIPFSFARASKSFRVIVDRKSTSSCMPSTDSGASLLALRISLVLRTCLRSLAIALGESNADTEGLCLASNSARKWSTRSMSMSSPPTDSSHLTALISNWPCCFFLPASLPSNVE